MAMIDRIKFDGLKSRNWIIYKYPSESLTLGSQLIVGEGQSAIFVKGGQLLDTFNAGTYTLNADNLPLLQNLLNIPFGGKTPFTAEIYFINIITKLDMYWGTSDPIQMVDPKYYVRLHIRAFGQIGIRIEDYRMFFTQLIGSLNLSDVIQYDKVMDFYKGMLVTKVKVIIANIILNEKISALEIAAHLDRISNQTLQALQPEFIKYGFTVVNFFVKSINFPEEDFNQINKILEDKASFEIIGDSRYVTKRSFDVYESAASNESGVAGAFAAGGLGLGAGIAVGAGVSATNPLNTNDGLQSPAVDCPKCGTILSAGSKFCGSCGTALPQKKLCSNCGVLLAPSAKFCGSCGTSVVISQCECGSPLGSADKFCSNCSKKVGD